MLKVSSVLIRSTEFIKVPVLEADCLDSTCQKKVGSVGSVGCSPDGPVV